MARRKYGLTEGDIWDAWVSKFKNVEVWAKGLQKREFCAQMLYLFCEWAEMNPDELLALKNDPRSREAELLLDRFVGDADLPDSVKVNCVINVRSFFRKHYKDLAREAGRMDLVKVKPYHKQTQEDLRRAWLNCYNPRDRAIITLAYSTAIAKESLCLMKWKHIEEDWEAIKAPHIGLPDKLIKGHGRGRYKGVEQHTFLTPEAVRDLKEYKDWMERKMGRQFTEEDHVFLSTMTPYGPIGYSMLGVEILKISERAGVPFSLHDARRYVQTAMEEIGMNPNWIKKIKGRKVRGEDNPYSRPSVEQLREKYKEAIPLLEFTRETQKVDEDKLRKKTALDFIRVLGISPEDLLEKAKVDFHAMSVDDVLDLARKLLKEKGQKTETNGNFIV